MIPGKPGVDITHILDPSCTRARIATPSRKRALEAAAEMLAAQDSELSARTIFDELMARERLGSTGLGEGVAIPHCRIPCQRVYGAFLLLGDPVDYDAADEQPVDLLFVLMVPPEETTAHLEALASLAGVFGEPENRATLRGCTSDATLFETIAGLCSSQAA